MESIKINTNELYLKSVTKKIIIVFSLLFLLFALVIFAVSTDTASLEIREIFNAILKNILPSFELLPSSDVERDKFVGIVVRQIRLPRIFMAIIAGMGLAVSGASMQGILRNPLDGKTC